MKLKLLASAAAAATLLALPAFAQTTTQGGYIGGSYGIADADDVRGNLVALEGAYAAPLGGTLGIQVDAAALRTDIEDFGAVKVLTGRGHLFTRTDTYLFGGFASITNSEFEDTGSDDSYGLGLEAQAYLPQLTLSGNIGWFQGEDEGDDESDGFGVGAEARYFVTPNFSLQAGIDWAEAEDDDATTFSLGAEYQLTNSPISLLAGFSHFGGDDDTDSRAFIVGIRFNGFSTLLDRDRRGPSL